MTYSKDLSNYDKEFIKNLRESELLIIDLDGTLINFEKIDNTIIAQMFPNSRVVKFLDNILWKINRLDILGNGYAGLKIRLAVYSLFGRYSLKECKNIYGKMYSQLAKVELFSVYGDTLIHILNDGYKIVIATKNVYAEEILKNNAFFIRSKDREKLELIVLKKDKKQKFKEMVRKYNNKVCIIGNNLSDDIINSYKIGTPYIYIGKSKAINFVLKTVNYISYKIGIKSIYKRGIQCKDIKQIKKIFKKR